MSDVIYLRKGAVYFYVGFMDENLKIPNIQTWVYLEQDPKDGHIFENAFEKKEKFCFPNGIYGNVLDNKALSEWLLEGHSPRKVAKEYEYKAI